MTSPSIRRCTTNEECESGSACAQPVDSSFLRLTTLRDQVERIVLWQGPRAEIYDIGANFPYDFRSDTDDSPSPSFKIRRERSIRV